MLKTKIVTALATGALCISVLTPAAFASTTIDISGNGSHSMSNVSITNSSNCNVSQSNSTSVNTDISNNASTGGNQASGNTGGDVIVLSGDATNAALVSVTGNSNTATNPCCGCNEVGGSSDISVDGNGHKSENKVHLKQNNNKNVGQTNNSYNSTWITNKAKTGKNKANNNTDGSSLIDSGISSNNTTVTVGGSTNNL